MAKPTTPQPEETGLVKAEDMGVSTMPDYLRKEGPGKGNENVHTEDLVIPRLGIIQDLSPELDADNPEKYIAGAKVGQMFNSLTRELYDNVLLCNLFFRKEFTVFVKRSAGGGFRGAYPTEAEAIAAVEASDKPGDMEVVETGQHFCLILSGPVEQKVLGEVVVSCTITKLKVSRNWNSLIRLRGGDRYAGTWNLGTVKEKNKAGQPYRNFVVSPGPWVKEEIYKLAEFTYSEILSGKKDVERTSDDVDLVPAGEEKF